MQCLSPSSLCFSPILPSLIFRSQSICQNCILFVKIFNDSDKIVVVSLKCSDDDSCDCNNQRCTSESQKVLVSIQLPVVFSYIDTYMCPYISRHISRVQAKAGVWAATQSLVALLPSYSPPPPNAAWATALSDWLPVRGTPTDPRSLRPETNIEERHILEETQRYTAEKKTEGEKNRKSKKRWWLWHVTSGSTYCTQVFTFSIPHCLSIRHRSSNHFDNLILLLGKSNWLWNTRCQSTKSLVAFLLLHDHNWSRCSVLDLEENDSQLIAGSSHSRKGFSKRDEYILHRTRVATIWKGPL